ncbi:MAG: RICIN domain-containing protein [Streptosporangiaceae bacterium]|nr:RICIN domain-containing protein [Streptosporangiaceae bacterium]
MRRHAAVAALGSGLLAAGAFAALTVLAGPAAAGVASSCNGTGTPVSCTVAVDITSPQSIELNASSGPSNLSVNLQWKADCTLAGQTDTTSGGTTASTPAWAPLTLGFSNPDSCNVTATATLTGTSSGTTAPTLSLNVDYNPQPGASTSPSASASASASSSPSPSYRLVRGFDGKCVDDAGNSSSLRAKMQIWNCNSSDQAEGITYSGAELKHNNMCLNAKGNGKSGSKVILWKCTGSANEIWVHRSNGEYVEKANGYKVCLDDPGYSTRNGTQLMVYTCNNGPNQHWSLP